MPALVPAFPRYGRCIAACKRGLAAITLSALIAAPAAAGPVTVAAFGDSLTQGYGLPQGEGLVPQLERWLRDRGAEVTVVNAGVSGDTTAGGLARIDWTLTPDIDAVIVALGGNDLLRGLDPAAARANLDGILSRIGERGLPVLLAGVAAPGNYGPDYSAEFDAIWPELAERHGTLLVADMLAPLTADTQASLKTLMQPDGLHPNAAGVARIVEALGPVVLELVARAGG